MTDVLKKAVDSFYLGMLLCIIITTATGGATLLEYKPGTDVMNSLSQKFDLQATNAAAKVTLNQNEITKETENPLAFDVIMGMINVGTFIIKIVGFVFTAFETYLTLAIYLAQAGLTGIIASLIVFTWQAWQFYTIAQFFLKTERLPG